MIQIGLTISSRCPPTDRVSSAGRPVVNKLPQE